VLRVIDWAAAHALPLPARWAALLHDLGKGLTPRDQWPRHHGHEARGADLARTVSERLKAPAECRDLAVLVSREHGIVHRAPELRAETTLRLLERCDALRRPQRFDELLQACEADFRGRPGNGACDYPPPRLLRDALAAVRRIDAAAIAHAGDPAGIAERLRVARMQAIQAVRGDAGT
jgi:tRNA nucleotidyltransferase (CCA-adding enzyme)